MDTRMSGSGHGALDSRAQPTLPMKASDASGDDRAGRIQDRVGADPTHGWRKGARGELRKSCDTCTSSKIKCCGGIPCDRCIKRGIDCKFSKRRRCGPKTRMYDEKRPRTGPSDESDSSSNAPEALRQPSYHYPPVGTIGLNDTTNTTSGDDSMPVDTSRLPPRGGNICADVEPAGGEAALDCLSELVELLAPSLGDGSGSGSNCRSTETYGDSASAPALSRRPDSSYALPSASSAHRICSSSQLSTASQGTSSLEVPYHPPGGHGWPHQDDGIPPSISPTTPLMDQAPSHAAEDVRQQEQDLFGSTSSSSRPDFPFASMLPPRERRPVDRSTTAPSRVSVTESFGSLDTQGAVEWPGKGMGGGATGAHGPATRETLPPSRGPLPMDLDPRCRGHLKTFMQIVGSILLLPGTDDLCEAMGEEAGDAEESRAPVGDVPLGSTRRRQHLDDPITRKTYDGGGGGMEYLAGTLCSARDTAQMLRPGSAGPKERGGDGLDELASARCAEAWAAVAVGAVLGGAGGEEAEEYACRAQNELSRCLDAALPEVASVMLLLSLFWMHSTNARKVMRYFGFAQQVAVELGDLMPEGLLYSMSFVSGLIIMTVDPAEAESHGVQIRDPAAWGVAAQSIPSTNRILRALTAATLAKSSTSAATEALQEAGAEGMAGSSGHDPRRSPLYHQMSEGSTSRGRTSPATGKAHSSDRPFDLPRVLKSIAFENDWTRPVRSMPFSSTAPGPAAVPLVSRSMGSLSYPGPMPVGTPRQAARQHTSDPIEGPETGGVAVSRNEVDCSSSSRCVLREIVCESEEGFARGPGGSSSGYGSRSTVATGHHDGGSAMGESIDHHTYDEDDDLLPPVSDPLSSSSTSFDAHGEDVAFRQMVFPSSPSG